jgi:hypothetical protein
MPRRICAVALAALSVALPVAAGAQASTVPAPHVTGAYVVWNKKDHVLVMVAHTVSLIPRRFDGLIHGAGIVGATGGSLGSINRAAHHCYITYVSVTKANQLRVPLGTTGAVKLIRLRVGMRLRAGVQTNGGTSTRTVKLRTLRRGDLTGKPLHC